MEGLRMSARALPVWAAFSVLRFSGAMAQELRGHSIESPPNIHSLASEWYAAGTVIPTHQAIVLNPGTPHRSGVLWSSYPLLTNNFEVSLTFKARRPATPATDAGFAFWYTPENGTATHADIMVQHAQDQEKMIAGTWDQAFKTAGLDLFSYKNTFEGLGVFFVEGQAPSVSAATNDGKKSLALNAHVPTSNAVKFDWLSGAEVTVNIRVHPDRAVIEVQGHGKVEVKHAFKAGGYIGLTAHGGNKATPESPEQSSYIEIKTLKTVNHDKTAKGEEVHVVAQPPAPTPQDEKVDVFAEASSFKDHRAESDAIKDLTNMVFKLVVETQPIRQQMSNAIETITKRVELMEKNFEDLKTELDKKTGHKLGAEFDAIKHELTSLSSVASKEHMERHSRLESLHADIAVVHKSANSPDSVDKHLTKLSESNSKVLDQLTAEHQKMFGVSIAAIAFIIIAGLSLYNKFRCWEKKHVL